MIVINETDSISDLDNNIVLEINAPSKKNIFKSTYFSKLMKIILRMRMLIKRIKEEGRH